MNGKKCNATSQRKIEYHSHTSSGTQTTRKTVWLSDGDEQRAEWKGKRRASEMDDTEEKIERDGRSQLYVKKAKRII